MFSYHEVTDNYPLWPVVLGSALAFWTYYVFNVVKKPMLAGNKQLTTFLRAHCPIVHEKYWPTPWCFESRTITIMRSLYKSSPNVHYTREMLKMQDGGQVALDWAEPDSATESNPASCAIVLILPGLVGDSRESYALSLVQQVKNLGYRSVVFSNRGNGGAELLTPRTYNAENGEDLRAVIAHIKAKYPASPLAAVGVSLGGLILTNYLTQTGSECRLVAAMTVSVAFNMMESSKELEQPVNKFIFNRHLANALVEAYKSNVKRFNEASFNCNAEEVYKSRTIQEFDDSFTCKQFGYPSYREYYAAGSIHEKLHLVQVPLLCLNAADDPFSPGHALPVDNARKSNNVCIMVTSHGGHIGYLEGLHPRHENYMDRVFAQYISAIFTHGEELTKVH